MKEGSDIDRVVDIGGGERRRNNGIKSVNYIERITLLYRYMTIITQQ